MFHNENSFLSVKNLHNPLIKKEKKLPVHCSETRAVKLGERRANDKTRGVEPKSFKHAAPLSKKRSKATLGRCYLSYLLEECILLNSFSREVMKNFTINLFWNQSVPHPHSCKSFLFQQEK